MLVKNEFFIINYILIHYLNVIAVAMIILHYHFLALSVFAPEPFLILTG